MPWKAVLEKAVSLGYCSYKSETSELYVHVGRREFGRRWAARYDCKENPKGTLKGATESCKGRYS